MFEIGAKFGGEGGASRSWSEWAMGCHWVQALSPRSRTGLVIGFRVNRVFVFTKNDSDS
jgi:hypothetical protein